jgi:hypothetical protein
MQVPLSSPIIIAGHEVVAIELRPPGRRPLDALRLEHGTVRFSEAAVTRFAARLSGHSEATIRRLSEPDLEVVGRMIDELYINVRRRFALRADLPRGRK